MAISPDRPGNPFPDTAKKRVLIVDDSVFACKIVSDMLGASPALEVVGMAVNGAEALVQIEKLHPDVITLDIAPDFSGNGLETLKRIMAEHPTPVVMLSSLTLSGASESIQALSIGAVDIMAKPHGSHNLGMSAAQRDELISKVIAAANVRLCALLRHQDTEANRLRHQDTEANRLRHQDTEATDYFGVGEPPQDTTQCGSDHQFSCDCNRIIHRRPQSS
ncbi:MAG: response regulator [Armatimonadetes bacterium]|nr:response regulator [Armatimonadota bacterium]